MELHWSHASSGKHGAAGEGFSVRDSRTIAQIHERNPEDDFECTYFRQPTTRSPTKEKKGEGLFPITICYPLPAELSDGYTDSESESDNTSNVERWLESLPANDAWSSAPNYSALDGSKGLEGVDEIQEDSKKGLEDDSNGIDDSPRSFAAETGDSKVRVTAGDIRQDNISGMVEWLDRKTPRDRIKRILKTRQKIPLWTKYGREAGAVIEEEKLLERKASGKDEPFSLLNQTCASPERGIPIDEMTAWSKSNVLETTESKTTIKKPPAEEDDYDEMMQEMVNRLLTVSACRKDKSRREQAVEKLKKESFSSKNSVGNLKKFFECKESEETVGNSLSGFRVKRARYSETLKKTFPKLSKSKTNGNQPKKCKKDAPRTKTQNPKRVGKISQRRKPSVTKHELKPVQKTRYEMTRERFVENIDPGNKKPLSRTVRFQDEVTTLTSSVTNWRQAAMVKAARNKQILKTVEQIVGGIQSEGLWCGKKNICEELGGVRKTSRNSISELEPGDAIELKKSGSWMSSRKRPMHSIENKSIESRKPVFSNPFVENCLDKAMDLALSKYKCPQNTWANFNKEKLRENMSSTGYEPPAKKRKPKSFTPKLENMKSQDFSLFNSWQSIHNYFLSYSSCN